MLKIVIVDDHQIVSLGISNMISKISGCEMLGVYACGKSFYESLNINSLPGLVFVDISMPNMSGLELLKEVKENYKSIKVVMLSMHSEKQYVLDAVKNKANGYLTKDSDEYEFVSCIENIKKNKNYFTPKISKQLREGIGKIDEVILTNREKVILKHIVDGLTSNEIGVKESIGKRTVETHRYNIMKKLDAVNSADLIRKVIEQQIIE